MNKQKQQKQLLKDIFTGSCSSCKFRRNKKVPHRIRTSTMKLGTFIIIPEVCLRIFPNFPVPEAAFEWFVLQKDVKR